MFLSGRTFRLILVMLAIALGSTVPAAASTCAPQRVEACFVATNNGDCPRSPTANDCVITCAPACGAILPADPGLSASEPEPMAVAAVHNANLPLASFGPDPPPPRDG